MAADAAPFPLPSLKFRTAGFPQYGFKPDVEAVPSSLGAKPRDL